VKNVFVLPGVVVALGVAAPTDWEGFSIDWPPA